MTCFEKNEKWASCRSSCVPGPDLSAPKNDTWTCLPLGKPSPGLPDWVWSECGKEAEDCRDSQCCRESGKQCYKQSDFWAQCKDSCIAGEKFSQWEEAWSCDLLGPRTQSVVDPDLDKGLVGEWVEKTHPTAQGGNAGPWGRRQLEHPHCAQKTPARIAARVSAAKLEG